MRRQFVADPIAGGVVLRGPGARRAAAMSSRISSVGSQVVRASRSRSRPRTWSHAPSSARLLGVGHVGGGHQLVDHGDGAGHVQVVGDRLTEPGVEALRGLAEFGRGFAPLGDTGDAVACTRWSAVSIASHVKSISDRYCVWKVSHRNASGSNPRSIRSGTRTVFPVDLEIFCPDCRRWPAVHPDRRPPRVPPRPRDCAISSSWWGNRRSVPPGVDVEPVAQVLHGHRRALDVPAREAFAPRGVPLHEPPGAGRLPEREVGGVALVRVGLQIAMALPQVLERVPAELAVARGTR